VGSVWEVAASGLGMVGPGLEMIPSTNPNRR
jgi:hypothetical protein